MTPRMETLAEGVTVWLGDCREIVPMLSGIGGVVTSPPYNQLSSLNGRVPSGLWGDRNGGLGFVNSWQSNGYSDDVPESEYQSQQNTLFAEIRKSCAPTASLFYNHQLRWRSMLALSPPASARRSLIVREKPLGHTGYGTRGIRLVRMPPTTVFFVIPDASVAVEEAA